LKYKLGKSSLLKNECVLFTLHNVSKAYKNMSTNKQEADTRKQEADTRKQEADTRRQSMCPNAPDSDIDESGLYFIMNIDKVLGRIQPNEFGEIMDVVSKGLYIIQKGNVACNLANIVASTNRLLHDRKVNRAEVYAILYYLQKNYGILSIVNDGEIPVWKIRDDIIRKIDAL
jgi:hypothetical protein